LVILEESGVFSNFYCFTCI